MDSLSLPVNTTPLKILIVEDNAIIRIAEKLLFESLKLVVDVAENGEQAIILFEPGRYSMVLLDIGLPDMSGYEVCKRLIKLEEGTAFHVPIIGISAHISPEEKDVSLAAGIEEMLNKPLLMEQAKTLLKRYGITESNE